nr:RNA-directed DNA polymerase, eukaryota [Tanacetum cinerariifolium]
MKDPDVVKDAFKDHFANRFKQPGQGGFKLDFLFTNRLSNDQVADLDRCISRDEIRGAIWNCGVNKSPGPDRATSASVFNGIRINDSTVISHIFYADDAIFMGEWSDSNMANIVKILRCFFLASGLKINIQKSQILGVGVHRNHVSQAALHIGCTVMQTPFWYLGVMVGDCMAIKSAWSDIVHKLHHRLSRWKVKTLSIGGRLTLLKSVLGATPLYNMSIYKVPIEPVILSSSKDRWTYDLNGDGEFHVKEAQLDRVPTRSNLMRRGVVMDYGLCLMCGTVTDDIFHVLFRCDLAALIFRKICRWWELDWQALTSFEDWNVLVFGYTVVV